MKKIITWLLAAALLAGNFLPVDGAAAVTPIRLKTNKATLTIKKTAGKTTCGTKKIKVVPVEGVKVRKITYKSKNKKIATVTAKGKVRAKKKGSTKIIVSVHYKKGRKMRTKKLTFQVKVVLKDTQKKEQAMAKPGKKTNDKMSSYQPRYSYECVFLTDLYNGKFYTYSMFGVGVSAVYIKTDNPNPDTINLKMTGKNGKEYSILGCFAAGREFYDIEYKTKADVGKRLRAVEGGYIGYVDTDIAWKETEANDLFHVYDYTYGNVQITVEEYDEKVVYLNGDYSRCAVAHKQTEYLHNFYAEMDAWMDEVIAKCTTDDMNVHEKMTAICSFLHSEFTYLPNDGTYLMFSALRIGPSYKIKAWDSYQSPAALCKFGEKLGYKLENMYFSGDWSMHYYAKGVFEGKTHYYEACPLSPTGYVDKDAINKIDLSRY